MNKLPILIVVCFLMTACNSNTIEKPNKPENLLSKDEMVAVIYDMTLLSSAKGINRILLENKGITPDIFIYQKHNIDSLQFALSNQYYAYDMKAYQQIYERVRKKLETDKKGFQKILEEERAVRDSLAREMRKRDSINKLNPQNRSDSLKVKRPNLNQIRNKDKSA